MSASIDAGKLDKLAKGVDSLGVNVSLTDEEYQEFLDLNTKLAELFPSLIGRIDGQGQVFLKTADNAVTFSESIDMITKSQQALADQALLADELFIDNWNKAAEAYKEAKARF